MTSLSKVLKSIYTTVSERREIHTIPVVKLMSANQPSQGIGDPADNEDTIPKPALDSRTVKEASAQILQQAETEAASILEEARRQSESLLAETRKQTEMMLQEANLQVEGILTEARASGFQQGFLAGQSEAESQYRSKIDESLELMRQIESDQKKRLLQSEQQLIELSVEIAQRIIEKQLETDNEWIVNTVKSALAEAVDQSKIEIYAHPEDIPMLAANKEEFLSSFASRIDLFFVAELSIRQGGCVLHTPIGTIDARLDTQLNEVRRALLEVAASLQP